MKGKSEAPPTKLLFVHYWIV